MQTKTKYLNQIILFIILFLQFSCNSAKNEGVNTNTIQENCTQTKIKFKLANFDKQGLLREDDLKNPIDYEFCVPNTPEVLNTIKKIDSSIKPTQSKGRTKCKEGCVLMIGNSYGKNIKKILCNLSQLEYVTEINQVYWE